MSNGFETCDQHVYLFATEGKDYPYCRIEQLEQELAEFKQWQKEDHDKLVQQVQTIDVLEQELQKTQLHLMEEETTRKIWEQDCKKAESQLVEARAEVERLSLENRQMLQGMKWDNQLKSEARQEAARECIEIIEYEDVYKFQIQKIKAKFGLEG